MYSSGMIHRPRRRLSTGAWFGALAVGWFLCWLSPLMAWAEGSIRFIAQSEVTAETHRLTGQTTLILQGEERIGPARILAYGPTAEPQVLLTLPAWEPRQPQTVSFDLPIDHPWPGWYHLLLEVRFQDQAGGWLNAALGVEYQVGAAVRSRIMPAVALHGHQVAWPTTPVPTLTLQTTTGPHWRLRHLPLTPENNRLALEPLSPDTLPVLGWSYPQVAALDWVEEGVHQSRIFEWRIQTDRFSPTWQAMQDRPTPAGGPEKEGSGRPADGSWEAAFSCLGVIPAFLLGVAVTLLMAFFFSRSPRRKGSDHPHP